jgi:hypothetical protein
MKAAFDPKPILSKRIDGHAIATCISKCPQPALQTRPNLFDHFIRAH